MRCDEKGFITADFLFSFIMVWGMITVFLTLTFTLTVMEVVQYMAFSTARTYFAGHESEQSQHALATAKFQQLMRNPAIAPLFKNGWFRLKPFTADSNTDFNQAFNADFSNDKDTNFYGVQLQLSAPILEKRLPLLGATFENEGQFVTNIGAFLNREITDEECRENFNKSRYEQILQLTSSQGGTPYNVGSAQAGLNKYFVLTDNGC